MFLLQNFMNSKALLIGIFFGSILLIPMRSQEELISIPACFTSEHDTPLLSSKTGNKDIPYSIAGAIYSNRLLKPKPVLDCQENNGKANNPIIWADVPDMSVIRVGNCYYMSSTTMHMSPGLPIMRSRDLVNWELVSYAYDTLADNEALRPGKSRP